MPKTIGKNTTSMVESMIYAEIWHGGTYDSIEANIPNWVFKIHPGAREEVRQIIRDLIFMERITCRNQNSKNFLKK